MSSFYCSGKGGKKNTMKFTDDGRGIVERVIATDELIKTEEGKAFARIELTEEEMEDLYEDAMRGYVGIVLDDFLRLHNAGYAGEEYRDNPLLNDLLIDNMYMVIMEMVDNNSEMIIDYASRITLDCADQMMEKDTALEYPEDYEAY